MTAPVLGNAVASLKSVKAGQAVTITCQDNENGDHEGVSAIKVEKVTKASRRSRRRRDIVSRGRRVRSTWRPRFHSGRSRRVSGAGCSRWC